MKKEFSHAALISVYPLSHPLATAPTFTDFASRVIEFDGRTRRMKKHGGEKNMAKTKVPTDFGVVSADSVTVLPGEERSGVRSLPYKIVTYSLSCGGGNEPIVTKRIRIVIFMY